VSVRRTPGLKSSRTVSAGKFLKLPRVEPVFAEKRQAVNYAHNRACFRSGKVGILDSSGDVERIIPFNKTNRKV
jgi:hypothetical protein